MLKHRGRKQFDGKNKDSILQKLEQAFSLGCTDEEAYVYAGISKSAFYSYQQKNPAFLDRKRALQTRLTIRARMTLMANLDNLETAQWYLSRKLPEEFGNKTQIKLDPKPQFNFSAEALKRMGKYTKD